MQVFQFVSILFTSPSSTHPLPLIHIYITRSLPLSGPLALSRTTVNHYTPDSTSVTRPRRQSEYRSRRLRVFRFFFPSRTLEDYSYSPRSRKQAQDPRKLQPQKSKHRSPKVAGISIFSLPLALSKTIVSNHAPQSRHKVPTVSSTETEETTIHYVAIGSEHHEAASSSAVFSIIPTSSMCRRGTPNFDGDRRPCGG